MTIATIDPRTPAERRYDQERDGTLYTVPATTDPLIACLDMVDDLEADDMVPGTINDVPLDLLVYLHIAAAIEQGKATVGISQDQVYALTAIVSPICEEYLASPARRAQLARDEAEYAR